MPVGTVLFSADAESDSTCSVALWGRRCCSGAANSNSLLSILATLQSMKYSTVCKEIEPAKYKMMPPHSAADDVSADAEMMLLVSLAMMRCLPMCRRHASLPKAASCACFYKTGSMLKFVTLYAFMIFSTESAAPDRITRQSPLSQP